MLNSPVRPSGDECHSEPTIPSSVIAYTTSTGDIFSRKRTQSSFDCDGNTYTVSEILQANSSGDVRRFTTKKGQCSKIVKRPSDTIILTEEYLQQAKQETNLFQELHGLESAHFVSGSLDYRQIFDPLPGITLQKFSLQKNAEGFCDNLYLLYLAYASVAKALERLHEKGIIHGDLKEDNVNIDLDVENPETSIKAHILDFGESARADSPIDTISVVFDQCLHIAPERRNQRYATILAKAKQDIFSFGNMLLRIEYSSQESRAPVWLQQTQQNDPNKRPSLKVITRNLSNIAATLMPRELIIGDSQNPMDCAAFLRAHPEKRKGARIFLISPYDIEKYLPQYLSDTNRSLAINALIHKRKVRANNIYAIFSTDPSYHQAINRLSHYENLSDRHINMVFDSGLRFRRALIQLMAQGLFKVDFVLRNSQHTTVFSEAINLNKLTVNTPYRTYVEQLLALSLDCKEKKTIPTLIAEILQHFHELPPEPHKNPTALYSFFSKICSISNPSISKDVDATTLTHAVVSDLIASNPAGCDDYVIQLAEIVEQHPHIEFFQTISNLSTIEDQQFSTNTSI
jgi:serine/threonine protein kinase